MIESYKSFLKEISAFIPKDRIYSDEMRRLAWGTDASFYRLIPQIVVRSKTEAEVSRLLAVARSKKLPVTFRAAGTSLSGQSVSDSILIVAGKNWEDYEISSDASTITMQPGIIGERVNQLLKPFGRIFTPDPASKNAAMVGGIVVNNASGMNCGTHANSDKMLVSVRIVLSDGTVLDTGDAESRRQFSETHPEFIREIERLRDEINADSELSERIRYKYSIKNVTGLNILPFIRYNDPFEIIAHLMVGSEGTLAFLSEVTMKTGHLYPHSASAMLYFTDIRDACRAVVAMKNGPVFSAELLDKKSLSSVNDTTGEGLTAVLTETKGDTKEELEANIAAIKDILKDFTLFKPAYFTDKPEEYSKYWAIRAGIFPSVGGTRPLGTTVLIEDVAFHIENLPEATADLADLIDRHGFDDACIYGHALEGNYHFIISQSFDTQDKVDRYRELMEDVEHLVVDKYDGSLKAEHGTGRNMAPFVRDEWGEKAYGVMKRVKALFDPDNLINPGVIFNDDPECFIKNIKPLPLASSKVDRCIECGFCERNCLTAGFTLSSRQRIIVLREMRRLKAEGNETGWFDALKKQYKYAGISTCAGDGLCSTSCPMKINTGDMIHDLRQETQHPVGSATYKVGDFAAHHLAGIKSTLRPVLSVAGAAHAVLGDKAVDAIGRGMSSIGLPMWSSAFPLAYYPHKIVTPPSERKVVYFPSCINQTMGRSKGDTMPLIDKMTSLMEKAGYEVIFPKNMKKLCCGTIWESKGMPDIADRKAKELEDALLSASQGGRYPVVCDQSPCLHRMRNTIKSVKLYEPVEFIYDFLAPNLRFTPVDEPIALHFTCSTRHMGVDKKFVSLAQMCSTNVVVPEEVGCCGFAGDKGFTRPEVNRYALRKLRKQLQEKGIKRGFSNSRTCEIGLTVNGGVPYQSIAYLVDECTTKK